MTFKEFLVKDGAVTIRHRNIQNIGIEMFKAKNNLSPKMMKEIFPDRNYSGPHLRSQVEYRPRVIAVFRTYSLGRTKNSASLSIFKNKIKTWIPGKFPCRLCKVYIQGL